MSYEQSITYEQYPMLNYQLPMSVGGLEYLNIEH